MPHTTFNQSEVAEYLHLQADDVQQMIKDESIPCMQRGGHVVFRRKEIDSWANQRILGMSDKRLDEYHRVTSARRHDLSGHHSIIKELMRPAYNRPQLGAKTRSSVVRKMVAFADETDLVLCSEDLLESVQNREALGTTALAGGFALLHTECHDPYMFEDSFILCAKTVQPIPFNSPDGQLTDLFFLLCCQDDRIHLHVLARMCMLCQNTRLIMELRECDTAEEMYAVMVDCEEELIAKTVR